MKKPTKKELMERIASLESSSASELSSVFNPPSLTQEKKTVWSVDMVQVLLELRLQTFGPQFQGSKSNQQLSIFWEKISMRLSVVTGIVVSHMAAKAKYHSLNQEFSRIRASEQSTGNNVDEAPTMPPYWDHLVEYFGDKVGLGHNEFGSSGNVEVANDDNNGNIVVENSDSNDEPNQSKRQKRRQSTASSNVGNGLLALGETLAKGLVDAASMNSSSASTNQKLDTLVETLEESRKIHAALLENILTGNELQRELLNHLQSIGNQ
ncbi:hypothetical protein AC1031_003781 [Aphanomyces cochlioides]|nr:hypothetical protein AC1031_003781 [Aphanomyces cochlioides]